MCGVAQLREKYFILSRDITIKSTTAAAHFSVMRNTVQYYLHGWLNRMCYGGSRSQKSETGNEGLVRNVQDQPIVCHLRRQSSLEKCEPLAPQEPAIPESVTLITGLRPPPNHPPPLILTYSTLAIVTELEMHPYTVGNANKCICVKHKLKVYAR